jgi:ribosomal protein S10
MKEIIAKSEWWDHFNMELYLRIIILRQQRNENL